jgi:predicted DCC family thiol-disulfide oxidoreductase YuxK
MVAEYIIIYDGECGICNYFAGWVAKNSSANVFETIPYKKVDFNTLPEGYTPELAMETVLLVERSTQRVYSKAKAVFIILRHTKGLWKIIGRLFANKFSSTLFNPLYSFIARNRSKISRIFGLQNCRIGS